LYFNNKKVVPVYGNAVLFIYLSNRVMANERGLYIKNRHLAIKNDWLLYKERNPFASARQWAKENIPGTISVDAKYALLRRACKRIDNPTVITKRTRKRPNTKKKLVEAWLDEHIERKNDLDAFNDWLTSINKSPFKKNLFMEYLRIIHKQRALLRMESVNGMSGSIDDVVDRIISTNFPLSQETVTQDTGMIDNSIREEEDGNVEEEEEEEGEDDDELEEEEEDVVMLEAQAVEESCKDLDILKKELDILMLESSRFVPTAFTNDSLRSYKNTRHPKFRIPDDTVFIFKILIENGLRFNAVEKDGACFMTSIVISIGERPIPREVSVLKSRVFDSIDTKDYKTIVTNYNICETNYGLGSLDIKRIDTWRKFKLHFEKHSTFLCQTLYPYVEQIIQATILIVDVQCKNQKIGLLTGSLHDLYKPQSLHDRRFVFILFSQLTSETSHFDIFTREDGTNGLFQYDDFSNQMKALLVSDTYSTPGVVTLFTPISQT